MGILGYRSTDLCLEDKMSLSCGLIISCLGILTCLILINFMLRCYFVLGSSFKHAAELGFFNLRVSFNRWVNLCSLWLLIYLDLFLPPCLFFLFIVLASSFYAFFWIVFFILCFPQQVWKLVIKYLSFWCLSSVFLLRI